MIVICVKVIKKNDTIEICWMKTQKESQSLIKFFIVTVNLTSIEKILAFIAGCYFTYIVSFLVSLISSTLTTPSGSAFMISSTLI